MSRRLLITMTLLATVALLSPVWAIEGQGRSGPSDEGVREREGGRRIAPQQMWQDGKTGTEEGLPEAKVESFDRGQRFRPQPRWRLGVYAYNTETGVVITQVVPNSPAGRAGFEPGDRIVTVEGYQVGFVGDRVFYLGEELQLRADARGRVKILAQNVRNNQLLNLDVRLEDRRHRERPIPVPYGRRGEKSEGSPE
jgi:hypothetical protein